MASSIDFIPQTSLTFRRPSEFHPAVTGPSLAAASLSVPMPSTFAGALMSAIDICEGSNHTRTIKLHERLERLGLNLYVGFASYRGKVYYYTHNGFIPLNETANHPKDKGETEYLVPLRSARIGIALNRRTKSVRPEYLYVVEKVYYLEGFAFRVLLEESRELPRCLDGLTVKLGGEQGLAKLKVDSQSEIENYLIVDNGKEDAERWEIVLISPALLDESPWNGVVELESSKIKKLGEMLVEGRLKVLEAYVPRGELSLEVVTTGWDIQSNKPKEPFLVVPAGSKLVVEASREKVLEVLKNKLGSSKRRREGWGTAVAIAL